MAEVLKYLPVMAMMLALAWGSRNREVFAGALVIAVIWVLWCGYILITLDYEPWRVGIVIDGLAAACLITPMASRWRIALGASYWLQVSMHVSYGLRHLFGFPDAYELYCDAIDWVCYGQIALIGVWAGGNIGPNVYRWWHLHAIHNHRTSSGTLGRKSEPE